MTTNNRAVVKVLLWQVVSTSKLDLRAEATSSDGVSVEHHLRSCRQGVQVMSFFSRWSLTEMEPTGQDQTM